METNNQHGRPQGSLGSRLLKIPSSKSSAGGRSGAGDLYGSHTRKCFQTGKGYNVLQNKCLLSYCKYHKKINSDSKDLSGLLSFQVRDRRAQNPVLAVSVLHCPIRTMGKSRTNRHIPASAESPRPRFGGLVHVNIGRVSPRGRQRSPAILEGNSIHPSGSKAKPEESYG